MSLASVQVSNAGSWCIGQGVQHTAIQKLHVLVIVWAGKLSGQGFTLRCCRQCSIPTHWPWSQFRPSAGSMRLLSRSTSLSPLSPVLRRGSLASTLQRGVSADISRIMKSGAPQREGNDAAPQVAIFRFCWWPVLLSALLETDAAPLSSHGCAHTFLCHPDTSGLSRT